MRAGKAERLTKETTIQAAICLDGGDVEVSTGIGFFDHMLEAFAVHGGFGLKLQTVGDLYVDGHHTVEDTGIVLGRAMAEALGGKSGIARFGSFFVPMDEPGLRGRGCQRPPLPGVRRGLSAGAGGGVRRLPDAGIFPRLRPECGADSPSAL